MGLVDAHYATCAGRLGDSPARSADPAKAILSTSVLEGTGNQDAKQHNRLLKNDLWTLRLVVWRRSWKQRTFDNALLTFVVVQRECVWTVLVKASIL